MLGEHGLDLLGSKQGLGVGGLVIMLMNLWLPRKVGNFTTS